MRLRSFRSSRCLGLFRSDIVLICIFYICYKYITVLMTNLILFCLVGLLISFLWKTVIKTNLGLLVWTGKGLGHLTVPTSLFVHEQQAPQKWCHSSRHSTACGDYTIYIGSENVFITLCWQVNLQLWQRVLKPSSLAISTKVKGVEL